MCIALAGRSFWLYSGGGCVAVSVCQDGALIRDSPKLGPSKEALKKIYMQSAWKKVFLFRMCHFMTLGIAKGCFTTIGT